MSAEKQADPPSGEKNRAWSDILPLLPKLLWFIFAVVVFCMSYKPVLDRLNSGEVAKVSFATFQIEFAREEFERAVVGAGREGVIPTKEFEFFAERIARSAEKLAGARALWVDNDHPSQNFMERRAFAALGISFDIAKSNDEAQTLFDLSDEMNSPYDFVISDIGRDDPLRPESRDPDISPCFPVPQSRSEAGCKLVQIVNGRYPGRGIPVILYSSYGDQFGTPPGAFGATGKFDDLLSLVLDAVERRQPRQGQPLSE